MQPSRDPMGVPLQSPTAFGSLPGPEQGRVYEPRGTRTTTPCEDKFGGLITTILGVVLVLVALGLLICAEYAMLISQATATEVQGAKVYPSCVPDPSASGGLVLVSGCHLSFPEDLTGGLPAMLKPFVDPIPGAALSWTVEIYQWVEVDRGGLMTGPTNQNDGRRCRSSYHYYTQWSPTAVDAGDFYGMDLMNLYDNKGTQLPSNFQSGQSTAAAGAVVMSQQGATEEGFILDSRLINQLPEADVGDKLRAPPAAADQAEAVWSGSGELTAAMLHLKDNALYTSKGDCNQVGDIRIRLTARNSPDATVCAVQVPPTDGKHYSFTELAPQSFGLLGLKTEPFKWLQAGKVSLDQLISTLRSKGAMDLWIFRVLALLAAAGGFWLIFSPLSAVSDGRQCLNICFCGLGKVVKNASQTRIGAAAVLLGLLCVGIAIGLVMFTVRPLVALALIAVPLVVYLIFVLTQGGGKACGIESDSDSDSE